jgi:ribonuclease-3
VNERAERLLRLQTRLGYTFTDPALLDAALTHASYAHEQGTTSNERLEFLGDAIVGAVVTHTLYKRYPNHSEAVLSQQKARIVCTETLANVGRDLEIPLLLRLGAGARRSALNQNPAKIEDATEALAAALFLDAGFARAAEILGPVFAPYLDRLDLDLPNGEEPWKNVISALHERVARPPIKSTAHAVVLGKRGNDHEPEWLVGWWVGGTWLAQAWGSSKRNAERLAARTALHALDSLLSDGWRPDRSLTPPEDEVQIPHLPTERSP